MTNLVTCSEVGSALAAWLVFSEDDSARYRLAQRLALKDPVPYAAGVPVSDPLYAVTYQGQVFAPRAEALPFTTAADFEPTWWRYIAPAQPLRAQVTYDPPVISRGLSSPVQTIAVPNAVVGAPVQGYMNISSQGLQLIAWVSTAGTVSWYILNPAGNPVGTVDLGVTQVTLLVG